MLNTDEGLKKRGLGEEIFLQPLYERMERQQAPADLAIEVFKLQGMEAFLNYASFKKEEFSKFSEA